MKVLVTGGAGYIGTALVAQLLMEGHSVRVLDKGIYSLEPLLIFSAADRFELRVGDVRNEETLANALDGMDAVVHLAAMVGEAACSIDEEATVSINEKVPSKLLALCEDKGVGRVVFLSTCSNYGVSSPDVLADEEAALTPLSLYARTKVAAERDMLGFNGKTVTTVLRFGTICGLSGRMRFDLLVSELARDAISGREIEIYKPEAWRPFLHVRDGVRAVVHVLGSDVAKVNRRVFNIVGENLRKSDLSDMVLKHFPDAKIRVTAANPDNRDYRVTGARIENELGFRCRLTVEDAFLETVESVRTNAFRDAAWPGHSAIPLPERKPLIGTVS